MDTRDEVVLLAAIAQGQIDDIIQSGVFKWEYPEPYQSLFRASQILRERGRDITLLNLFSECRLDADSWKVVRELWEWSAREPKVNWRSSAGRLIDDRLRLHSKESASKLLGSTDSPRQAIARTVTELDSLLARGSVYNPTPSFHYNSGVMGEVIGTTGISGVDTLLDGGLWTQALIGVALPSNHGKSTLTYSLLAQGVYHRRRCNLFTFETNTATAVARILSALTGLHVSETSSRKAKDSEGQKLIDGGLEMIDEYFSIYDNSFNDPAKMERVISLERPALSCVDHISMLDPKTAQKNTNRGDQSGDLADAALQWTINYALTIVLNSQLSNEQQKELKRSHDLAHTALFGSSRIYNALDFAIIGLRHWMYPNQSYFRKKKDRKLGVLDTDIVLYHDPYSQSYRDL